MDPYVGEIRLVPFNFAPVGWQFCDGSLLSISDFEVLFILIGTTYGGNGTTTFAVPDLRGRAVVNQGPGYLIGTEGGSEVATIGIDSLASHSHFLQVSNAVGSQASPTSHYPAVSASGLGFTYGSVPNVQMSSNSVGSSGSGQPHENMQPFLTLNYVISLYGVFPSQN